MEATRACEFSWCWLFLRGEELDVGPTDRRRDRAAVTREVGQPAEPVADVYRHDERVHAVGMGIAEPVGRQPGETAVPAPRVSGGRR